MTRRRRPAQISRVDAVEFHWLVGILEGEGTFLAAAPSKRGVPVVRVSMTDRDIVERVGRLLDRAVTPVRARRSHHKTPYATTIKGTPAVSLMTAVRPALGALRRVQIDRAIASWHGRPERWRRPRVRCSAADCTRPGARRGLCKRHYDRWWRAKGRGRSPQFAPLDAPSSFEANMLRAAPEVETSVAWLAGLLEGEGTFRIHRDSPTHAYPVVSVDMCDRGVVERAARLLGAPSVQRRDPDVPRWSATYVAAISGHDAAGWMRRLRPHMGHRRTEAIDAALAAYHPIRLVDPPATCVVPDCAEPHRSRGLCHKHYMMWSRDRRNGREVRITPLR